MKTVMADNNNCSIECMYIYDTKEKKRKKQMR